MNPLNVETCLHNAQHWPCMIQKLVQKDRKLWQTLVFGSVLGVFRMACLSIWGCPKIRGTLLGAPIMRINTILGSTLASPIKGNYHIELLDQYKPTAISNSGEGLSLTPKGSMQLYNIYRNPKVVMHETLWAPSIYYIPTWTLWGLRGVAESSRRRFAQHAHTHSQPR